MDYSSDRDGNINYSVFFPCLSMALSSIQLLLVTFLFALVLRFRSQKQKSLPPGPPADPLIGHLRAIPSRDQGRVFHSWAKLYGSFRQFFILKSLNIGQAMLCTYDYQANQLSFWIVSRLPMTCWTKPEPNLAVGQSSLCTSCQSFHMYEFRVTEKLVCRMGWVPDSVLLPYGPQSIKHRKIFQRHVGRQEAVLDYQNTQYHEACVLLQNLLARPGSYDEHFRRYALQ